MKNIYLLVLFLWRLTGANSSLCLPGQSEIHVNRLKSKSGCTNDVCSSLTDLVKESISLENKCILLENSDDELNQSFIAENLKSFAMVSSAGATIRCSDNVGFFFLKIKTLKLSGGIDMISFINCGRVLERKDTSPVKVSLYLKNVGDAKLEKITCRNYQGHGIIVDELDNNLNADNIILKENSLYCRKDSFCNGGGLQLNFSKTVEKNVNFKNVEFSNLQSSRPRSDPSIQHDRKAFYDVHGKGSAIAIQLYENAKENHITFKNILLENNYAEYGGSIVVFDSNELNKIQLISLKIRNSTSLFHGGGILYYSSSNNSVLKNPFLCKDCTFMNCSTIYGFGGAIWIYRTDTLTKKYKNYTLQNSVFDNNQGVSADIFSFNLHLFIHGGLNSTTTSRQTKVILQNTKLYIHDNAEISHSLKGGINGEHSSIFIYGKLIVANNTGTNGGGISLYGRSSIVLDRKAILLVYGNKANIGSGLFASITATNHLLRCECLFGFEDENPNAFEGQVLFRNNTDNDLFVSTQACCKVKIGDIPNFELLSSVPLITNPIRIESNKESWENLYPGERKKHDISLIDDFGQVVDGSIDITVRVKDKHTADYKKTYYIYANVSTTVVIDGIAPDTEYSLIFSFTYNFSTALTFENLKLKPCPMFLQLKDNKCVCDSNAFLEKELGGIFCLNGEVYFAQRYWTVEGEMNKTHDERKSGSHDYQGNVLHCPYGYCDTCKQTSCLYNPRQQCSKNRKQNSRLCSQCVKEAYLNLAGDCILLQLCPVILSKYLYYVTVIILAMFTWFLVVLLLCPFIIKLAGDYLLPVVYFYIVVPYLLQGIRFISHNKYNNEEESTREEEIIRASFISVKWIYLWASSIFCSPEITRMDMEFLNFLCGGLLLPIPLYFALRIQRRLGWISRFEVDLKRLVIVIGFILVSNTLIFSLNVIHYANIGTEKYMFVYAAERFLGKWYYLCAFIFSVFLILGIFYITVAIFITTTWSAFELCGCKYSNNLHTWSDSWLIPPKLKPTLVYLQSGFENNEEKDRTWFCMVYIVFIVTINTMVVYTQDEMLQTTMVTLIVLIFLVIYASIRPYTNTKTNFFEMVILGILIVVGVTVDASKGSYYFNYHTFLLFLVFLLFTPIGIFLFIIIIKKVFLDCRPRFCEGIKLFTVLQYNFYCPFKH